MNRVIYTEYDETGRITGIANVDAQGYQKMKAYLKPHIIAEGNPETQYVSGGQLVNRPLQQTTLTNQTLNNLPVPSTVTINDVDYPCNDTVCELAFSYPGTYLVRVTAFPHLDYETVVTI